MHLTTPPFRIDIPHQKLLKQIAKRLNNKGLGYGSGHLSPRRNQFYVNIPKNASSYISVWLVNNNWESTTYKNSDNVGEAIIILRDPVNRWISGISQYLSSYVVNDDKITPQIFNEFYHSCPVIGSSQEIFRIKLVKSFKQVLESSLYLLGIKTIDKM